MVLESLPSRRSTAAAAQSASGLGHRRVREAWFRTIVLWVERKRCTPHPLLSETSFSAT